MIITNIFHILMFSFVGILGGGVIIDTEKDKKTLGDVLEGNMFLHYIFR